MRLAHTNYAERDRQEGAADEMYESMDSRSTEPFPLPGSIVNLQFLPSAARCFVLGLVLAKRKGKSRRGTVLTKMHFDVLGVGQKKRNLKKSPHAFWQPHGF